MLATIEEVIVALNKTGWRVSNLSYIGQRCGYSLILEKDAKGDSGVMFAFNRQELDPTPLEAFQSAWANIQAIPASARVFEKGKPPGKVQPEQTMKSLLALHTAAKYQLEEALRAHIKVLAGEDDEDDDFL